MEEQAFFTSALLKLLAFSAVAALLIIVLWQIGKFILICAGSTKSDDGSEAGCGCLVLICIGVLCWIVSCTGEVYDDIIADYLNDSNPMAKKADMENGPLVIFKKEHGLLYNHYEKLQALIRKNEQTCDSLQYEMNNMSTEGARRKIARRMDELRSENVMHQKMIDNINELAGRYYFARMMDNLGLRVNQDELNAEIGIMKLSAGNND